MKLSQITLRWAGPKVQNGCKNPAIVHGRVRDDVKKQTNEEKRQMKNNNKMKIKNEMKNNSKMKNKNEEQQQKPP